MFIEIVIPLYFLISIIYSIINRKKIKISKKKTPLLLMTWKKFGILVIAWFVAVVLHNMIYAFFIWTFNIEFEEPEIKFAKHSEFHDQLGELVEQAQHIQVLEEKPTALPTAPAPKPEVLTKLPEAPPVPQSLRAKMNFLDLKKLNPLLQDQTITMIQCEGSDSPIKINKQGQIQETQIILTYEEIREIIQKFSLRAQAPLTQPIFKAETGNLAITATLSHESEPSFVIVRK